ncbi:hypothetical protein BLNAU_11707 [Blattamonas nauphoetae]|uniref:Protein kinase domain-containing protein n=1 Tax=Blattamonas nauphoetae TaxID=2049346 RepID=A0ABQ9XLY3_9EUKA|nr:hypothetical protein BLNAU_11707 [Blattamonas nauphoetae]
MNSILVVVQVLLSAQSQSQTGLSAFTSNINTFCDRQVNEDHRHHEIQLDDDFVISSTIQIWAEGFSLKGNDAVLMFPPNHEPHSSPIPSSPVQSQTRIRQTNTRKQNFRSGTTSNFMFDVSNSTFSASGVHVMCDSENNGFCLVSSSTVHFSSSSITSNGMSSPFMTRIGLIDEKSASTIVLSSITHLSNSATLPPLVGLFHTSICLVVDCSKDASSFLPNQENRISIFGTGLTFESTSLSSGTGPLFSFGLADHASSLPVLGNDVEMETSLSSSSFVNVTSSLRRSSSGQLFGSEVWQRVICCSMSESTNHNSGTGILDANVGGNLVCLNSSFTNCQRSSNEVKDFINENITQTHIGRLNNVTSTVTSVTYTLCTFNTMTVATGQNLQGGAAIFIYGTSSSLTVEKCFFHKCSCTGLDDDGGALCVVYRQTMKCPVSISDSSFTECTALGRLSCCGGAVVIADSSLIKIENCFFEQCQANYDGALFIGSSPVTLSNCAFVMCLANGRAGTILISGTSTTTLNYLQFRDCLSVSEPQGSDLYFNSQPSSQITSETVKFCDSTSGSPNVYFSTGKVSNSNLIPQIASKVSISSMSVVFSGTQAIVTVSTDKVIKGSMKILLGGSNVPRLVHIVFGNGGATSSTGQATISSGANGILPNATYIPRSAVIVGHEIPLPSFIAQAEATLLDSNTTEIVVRGKDLLEGSYWMEVWDGSTKWNISLEWQDSSTLKGTAPLYPSTADGRLDWSTEYEVRKVVWKRDQQAEKEVVCSGEIKFTTPDEPARIEDVDCHLNGARDVAVVELEGVQLVSLEQTAVLLGVSSQISSSGPIFDVTSTKCFVGFLIGEEENSTHVVFGGRYKVVSVGSGDNGILVKENLFVDIPLPPTITKIDVPVSTSSSSFFLSVEGTDLPSGSSFVITLSSLHSFNIQFTSDTTGASEPIAIGGAGQLKYDTQYILSSVTQKVGGKEDQVVFFSASSFTTPTGPTLSSLSCSLDPSDPDFFILSLTTSLMPSEDFILLVTNTASSSETVSITVPSASLASGSLRVEVYNKTGSLRYDSSYSVSSMTSSASSVVAVVSAESFPTPDSPARIVEVDCDLDDESEKSAIVKISGVSLVGEKTFTLSLARIISENELSEDVVEITGTLSGDLESTSHTLTILIFGSPDSPLAYGCSYRVTDFTVTGMPSKVDNKVTFRVPDEPPRIVSIESRKLNKERTKVEVVMIGRALKSGLGKVGLMGEHGVIDSLEDVVVMNETHCSANFSTGEEEGVDKVKFGGEYTLLRSASSASGFHVEETLMTVPYPPKVTKMEFSFSNLLNTSCRVSLSGKDLIVGSLIRVTLTSSLSFSATITSKTEGLSEEMSIGRSDTLQYNTKYTLTSITPLDEEGDTLFDDHVSDTTGLLPSDLFIYTDSGSSSDTSVFCGEHSRPCASIGVGWKIAEGVGIGRVSFGIIDSSSLSTRIVVSSGMHVLVTNGSQTEPTLRIPSSASSLSSAWLNEDDTALIVVRASFFEIRHVNVVLDSQPSSFHLVSSTDSTIILKDASLHGTTTPSSSNSEGLCHWETGLLLLTNSTSTVDGAKLTHLSCGGVNMKNGSLTLISPTFSNNSPGNPSFPSLRRNIHCSEGGMIEIDGTMNGDGSKDSPSAWISSDNCTITGKEEVARAPMFIPSLNTDETSVKQTSDKIGIWLVGTLLIPCGLGVEVREWDEKEKKYGKNVTVSLTELNTTAFTETGVSLEMDVSDWKSQLDWTMEWRARLWFGKDETTGNEIVVKMSSAAAKKAEALETARKTLPWLIPVIVVMLLVVLIFVFVVCCRAYRKKNGTKSGMVQKEELEAQEVDEKDESMEVERMDGENVEMVALRAKNTNMIINHNLPTTIGTQQVGHAIDTIDTNLKGEAQLIELREVVRCDGQKSEVVTVNANDTLFNRLHRQTEQGLDKPRLVQMLTRGLAQLSRQNPRLPLLTQLSPLWVFLDADDTPLFQVNNVKKKEAEPQVEPSADFFRESYLASLSNQTLLSECQREDRSVNQNSLNSRNQKEGERWRALEVVEKKGEINDSKAAVFSLGLMLWEIETGQVPFAEQDGVNAQRQVGIGVLPAMESWTEEWKVSLIRSCLNLSPDDRPTLDSIVKKLDSHLTDGKGGKGQSPNGMEA